MKLEIRKAKKFYSLELNDGEFYSTLTQEELLDLIKILMEKEVQS